VRGQDSNCGQQGERDQVIRRRVLAGVDAVERNLQGVQLRCGDRTELLGRDLVEEIDEAGVGQARLGLTRAGHQDPHASILAECDPLLPQAGLPDTGVTFQDERSPGPLGTIDQTTDHVELVVARDQAIRPRSGIGRIDRGRAHDRMMTARCRLRIADFSGGRRP
jgi:hypothetical protein